MSLLHEGKHVSRNRLVIETLCSDLTVTLRGMGFPGGSDSKCPLAMQETWVQSLDLEDLLEKEMATHSSILAWKIPWMEEPGRLQSMGSQSDTTE